MTRIGKRIMILLIFMCFLGYAGAYGQARQQQTVILEVTADPHEVSRQIQADYPLVEVLAVYDELLQGIAMKADHRTMEKLLQSNYIRALYPEQIYRVRLSHSFDQANRLAIADLGVDRYASFLQQKSRQSFVLPEAFNDSDYTGKGVKLAVIDTGIDLYHPDLQKNYQGGFDLIDLDDEPMETREEEGMPTDHGTHVAGIIAADGQMKGIAPDVDLYVYRALGPGGVGSSVHIIAAMEEAIKAGVDIINLSLGNSVNSPDYPTSKAVVEASKRGVAVIVANGNAGPASWTIGSPATAPQAFSVGAYAAKEERRFLQVPDLGEPIRLGLLPQSTGWNLERDYVVQSYAPDMTSYRGIVMMEVDGADVQDQLEDASAKGAVAILLIVKDKEAGGEPIYIDLAELEIPVAVITEEDGSRLKKRADREYVRTVFEQVEDVVAPFSSRGPVAMNWMIKPNIVAPGVDIFSTVTNGYNIFSGTSMAAPYISGVVALIKEARPDWSNEQIFAALETGASRLTDEAGRPLSPSIQGSGLVNFQAAIHSPVLVENGLLSFGRVTSLLQHRTARLTLHNLSEERQTIQIEFPRKQAGLQWQIPSRISLEKGEQKTIPISLDTKSLFLEEGLHEGWLQLNIQEESVELPYLFIHKTADYEKISGLSFRKNPMDEAELLYDMQVIEAIKWLKLFLYQPEDLLYVDQLFELKGLEAGEKKGKIARPASLDRTWYYGVLVMQTESGEIRNEVLPIYLPETP